MSKPRDQQLLKRIGQRIQAARSARGFTQEALAEAAGCQPVTLKRYEAGQRAPDIAMLVAIARVLGLSAGALMDDDQDPGDVPYPADTREILRMLATLDDERRDLARRLITELSRTR